MEMDERDRQKERDELEGIRRKLTESGQPEVEVEAEMARVRLFLCSFNLFISLFYALFLYRFCVS